MSKYNKISGRGYKPDFVRCVDPEHPTLRGKRSGWGTRKTMQRGDHSSGPSITRKLDAAYPRVRPCETLARFTGYQSFEQKAFSGSAAFQSLPRFFRPSSRASSSLLFGLAPRGVCRAPDIATGTVGSYPTFSPLPVRRPIGPREVLPLAGRRGAFLTGGLFSVALSVAEAFLLQPPDVIRRVALTVPKRRSPDFPPTRPLRDALRRTDQRSPDSPAASIISGICNARKRKGMPGVIS